MTNFGHVIKDRKLATNDRETKSGHWYADFGHFFITNLSFSTSEKWEISDQKNDQNPHINDHFWFGDRWWLIYGLLLRNQNWSFLFWSFIAC